MDFDAFEKAVSVNVCSCFHGLDFCIYPDHDAEFCLFCLKVRRKIIDHEIRKLRKEINDGKEKTYD